MDEAGRVVQADRGSGRRLVRLELIFGDGNAAIAPTVRRQLQEVEPSAAHLKPVAVVVYPPPTSVMMRHRVNHFLARLPTSIDRDLQLLARPRRIGPFIRVRERSNWTDIANVDGAERFPIVRLPRLLVDGATLVLIVPFDSHHDQLRPIEALAALSHPRQAIAARLDQRRQGIAAELAARIVPRLIVLLVEHLGHRFIVITNDRIAAELLAAALRQDAVGDIEHIAPWEDSIVQRGTQLDLGVRLPHDMVLTPWWSGTEKATGDDAGQRLVERLRLRLGLASG